MDVNNLCMNCFTQHSRYVSPCPVCGYTERADAPPHLLRPRTILNGKYLLGNVLGEGGFGITYIGWDLNLHIKVAIKEYYPTGFVTRETTSSTTVQPFAGTQGDYFLKVRDKFVNEARTLAKFFSLPGIVAVKDYFLENGTAYIVMEYVEGQTLKEYLVKMGGKLPAAQVFDMMRPVMSSLAEIHKTGLIHRDISPDNIMISKDGYMKLLDFGAAREFSESGAMSMTIMLKPGFAPEEQYRTKGVQGPWTDIYALCATMYKCITGITPEESVERMHNDTTRPPSALGIPIEPRRELAMLKGMSVFQRDRFQTVAELNAALYSGDYSAPYAAPAPPPKPVPVPEPPKPAPAVVNPCKVCGKVGPWTDYCFACKPTDNAKRSQYADRPIPPPPPKAPKVKKPMTDNSKRNLVVGTMAIVGVVIAIIVINGVASGSRRSTPTPMPPTSTPKPIITGTPTPKPATPTPTPTLTPTPTPEETYVTDRKYGKGTYTGDWKNNQPHGYGVLLFSNGDVYDGGWLNGKYHGTGTYTWTNGNEYVGEWEDDKRHGWGVLKWASGGKFEGDWSKDERVYGTETMSDGRTYTGGYLNDKFHGQATFTWPDGEIFVGEFKNGLRNGKGKSTFANGNTYDGDWIEGNRTGQGTFTWTNGDKYVGEFKEGYMDGTGTYTWTNGQKYVGSWKSDKRHGQGTQYAANGNIIHSGTWADGSFVG